MQQLDTTHTQKTARHTIMTNKTPSFTTISINFYPISKTKKPFCPENPSQPENPLMHKEINRLDTISSFYTWSTLTKTTEKPDPPSSLDEY